MLISINFSTPEVEGATDPFYGEAADPETAKGLLFARCIFNSHGGEVKFLRSGERQARFDVEMPAVVSPIGVKTEIKAVARKWTTLVVEPDGSVQRKLLTLLSACGHRVVPVSCAEEAIDLLERLSFDLAFCSVRLPGRSWIDFYEKVRHRLDCFVLVTEGTDEGLSRVFEGSEGHLLRKPIDDRELEQLLARIENRRTPSLAINRIAVESEN